MFSQCLFPTEEDLSPGPARELDVRCFDRQIESNPAQLQAVKYASTSLPDSYSQDPKLFYLNNPDLVFNFTDPNPVFIL